MLNVSPGQPSHLASTKTTSLCFSPFANDLFLVGQADGQCRLHQLDCPTPILSWSCPLPPQSVGSEALFVSCDIRWSQQRPGVFFLLHGDKFCTFDLCKDDTMPIHTLALSDELNLPLCSSPLGLAVTHGRAHHQNFLAVTYSDAVFVRKLTNYVGKEPHEEMDELRARLDAAVAI